MKDLEGRKHQKYREYLEIENPNEAMKAILLTKTLTLEEVEEVIDLYIQLHGVTFDEMSFYPNGEQVSTGLFW